MRYRALLFLPVLALLAVACTAESEPGAVHVLTADTEVNGVLQRYLDRGIDRAERDGAAAVVILIDTPGGAIDSMREIVGSQPAGGLNAAEPPCGAVNGEPLRGATRERARGRLRRRPGVLPSRARSPNREGRRRRTGRRPPYARPPRSGRPTR